MIELSSQVINQWKVLWNAFFLGVGLGGLYEFLCFFRRRKKQELLTYLVLEFGYWVVWTIATFVFVNNYDLGKVRGCSFLAVILGMFLVHQWIFPRVRKTIHLFQTKWGNYFQKHNRYIIQKRKNTNSEKKNEDEKFYESKTEKEEKT